MLEEFEERFKAESFQWEKERKMLKSALNKRNQEVKAVKECMRKFESIETSLKGKVKRCEEEGMRQGEEI